MLPQPVDGPSASPFRAACRRLKPDEASRSAAVFLASYAALVVVFGAVAASLASLVA